MNLTNSSDTMNDMSSEIFMAMNVKILSWVVCSICGLAGLDLRGSDWGGHPGVSTKYTESTNFTESFASRNHEKLGSMFTNNE